jgi:hypothetical protein
MREVGTTHPTETPKTSEASAGAVFAAAVANNRMRPRKSPRLTALGIGIRLDTIERIPDFMGSFARLKKVPEVM